MVPWHQVYFYGVDALPHHFKFCQYSSMIVFISYCSTNWQGRMLNPLQLTYGYMIDLTKNHPECVQSWSLLTVVGLIDARLLCKSHHELWMNYCHVSSLKHNIHLSVILGHWFPYKCHAEIKSKQILNYQLSGKSQLEVLLLCICTKVSVRTEIRRNCLD
jgi:hypothetical protein